MAATDAQFGYSRAMRASSLRWDAATLDRFLAAPVKVVPETTMTIPTDAPGDRKALIAYLSTLRGSIPAGFAVRGDAGPSPMAAPGLRTGRAAFGGFQSDAPGVRRRITVADLPAPFATESARNNAKVVDAPAGAEPMVPPGFHVALFAKDLKSPRLLRVAPNGDVFAAASDAGEIQVLRAREGAAIAERVETFAKGLDDPFGIAFFPAGPTPQWLYVAEANAVRRYPYENGDLTARGAPETVIARLAPTSAGHTMRDIAFSHDDQRLFVAVGSGSNVAEDLPARSPDAIRAFEAAHGLATNNAAVREGDGTLLDNCLVMAQPPEDVVSLEGPVEKLDGELILRQSANRQHSR